jgi:hypothetical protein
MQGIAGSFMVKTLGPAWKAGNPKSECRNPKQTQITEIRMTKTWAKRRVSLV